MVDELEQEGFEVAAVCQALGVSRSAYYGHRNGSLTARQRADNQFRPRVRKVFLDHKARYGARRIAAELNAQGQCCGSRRVRRIMQEMGLEALQPKSFRPQTTNSAHGLGYSPNLLLDAPPPTGINQVWVGDITYVLLLGGVFAYLSMLMDLYSRRLVGWALERSVKAGLVLSALGMAIQSRKVEPGVIHHSDRGGQFAADEYRRILRMCGMLQSMSRAGNVYDNAFMESCFSTIKRELHVKAFASCEIALAEIRAYVRYYNTRRRHSSLGNVSPDEFERRGK